MQRLRIFKPILFIIILCILEDIFLASKVARFPEITRDRHLELSNSSLITLIRILFDTDQRDLSKLYFIKHQTITLTSIYILERWKFVCKHFELYYPIKIIKRNNSSLNQLKLPFHNFKLIQVRALPDNSNMCNVEPNYIWKHLIPPQGNTLWKMHLIN